MFKSSIKDSSGNAKPIEVQVSKGFDGSLLLKAIGYSDCCSEDDQGVPLVIENNNGILTLRVFSDINQEDPTDVISLSNARNKARTGNNDDFFMKQNQKVFRILSEAFAMNNIEVNEENLKIYGQYKNLSSLKNSNQDLKEFLTTLPGYSISGNNELNVSKYLEFLVEGAIEHFCSLSGKDEQ
ncbi:TPA: hypothetical protein I7E69_001850 [Vibrio cholerae]|nr:hypothetical protein [Vibrio cholerae]